VKIGILAGAFNPVTRAHVALAEAARAVVDEIVCVLPRAYPHKEMHGATIEERMEMLRRAGAFDRVEVTNGGLFLDIARELPQAGELYFVCGRDAAERVLNWKYDEPGKVSRMLAEFRLLVASRDGEFEDSNWGDRVVRLSVDMDLSGISSTEVRRRIATGEAWEQLVPESLVEMVSAIYR
jgi:nicotinate (nicotinamide) nucleotide adenylyltransferase